MRIVGLATETIHGRKKISATVHWENSQRSPMEIYFETHEAFAGGLDCNADAFLTACILPALHHGEERLYIDAAISPEIQRGLMEAQAWMQHWWYSIETQLVKIESNDFFYNDSKPIEPRTGIFFSGGVDSLASLRSNRLTYDSGYPLSMKDGFLVFGLETGTGQEDKFNHVMASLAPLAEDGGIDLIPVYTNIRYLDDDWMFWERQFQDAVFAAVAHAFHHRVSVMNIASSYDIPHIKKCGTHPVLDIAYSTYRVRILHDSITLTRLDKIRLLGQWQAALDHMRVCNRSDLYQLGMLNCGECWKCVKTRLALMCLGLSEHAGAFPQKEITEDLVESTCQIYTTTAWGWEELIQPLKNIGHENLAVIIEKKIDRHLRQMEKAYLLTSIAKIAKRYDQKYFKGNLRQLHKYLKARKRHGTH